jgi:hypothetical protein
MAFNPLHTFSLRSRTGRSVLAVLTIVVMFMFVLSSGAVGTGMDFFDQIGALFGGGKGSKGEVLAVAFGEKIREGELSEVQHQRRAARIFLDLAVQKAYDRWAEELAGDAKSGRLAPETKAVIERFTSLRANREKNPRAYAAYVGEFFQFGQEMQRYSEALRKARLKPDGDDKKALDAMAGILLHDQGLIPVILTAAEIGDSDRATVDFIMLQKKADRMGVRFTDDGIISLINRDTGNRLREEDRNRIAEQVRSSIESRQGGGFSGQWLLEAIGNEYRARTVLAALQGKSLLMESLRAQMLMALGQQAMILQFAGIDPLSVPALGEPARAGAPPGGLTPYEFFEFYRDRVSENTFAVLEVNAEAFLDQVPGAPTQKERIELFNRYRGELPDPSRDRPGFKEPRKVKVEFVTLDAKAPRVTEAIPKVRAASQFLSASSAVISGSPVSALLEASQPAIAESMPVREAVSDKVQANWSPFGRSESFFFMPRDTSIFRPQPIISALGVLAGHPDITTATAAAVAVHQHVERLDHQARIPFLIQPVLTPFSPTLANALGLPAFSYALNPKLPPEGLYLGEAIAAAKDDQRRRLFQADIEQLETKLRKLIEGDVDPNVFPPPKPDKAKLEKGRAEARKHLTEWLKERGLTAVGTKAPVDQWAVVSDPDLAPLNTLATAEPDGTNSLSKRLFPADPRFNDTPPFRPFWFPLDPAGEGLDRPNHLVWVSEEIEARTFNTLENADKLTNGEMTRRVDRQWRLNKARDLAKAEADRLAEQVRAITKTISTDPGGVRKQLRDLAAQKNVRFLELERLAPLQFQHGATQPRIEYAPPKIERTQVLYPTPDFTDKLLELRKEPLGAVTVLPDSPRTRFYVAAVVERFEKTMDQFREVFDKAGAPGIAHNPLYDRALGEERVRAYEAALARLRAEAGLEIKDALKNREKKDVE